VGPRAGLDAMTMRKISSPCRESNPSRPACSLVATLTQLSRLLAGMITSQYSKVTGTQKKAHIKQMTKVWKLTTSMNSHGDILQEVKVYESRVAFFRFK
jgi:hypothetical protein